MCFCGTVGDVRGGGGRRVAMAKADVELLVAGLGVGCLDNGVASDITSPGARKYDWVATPSAVYNSIALC